MPAKVDQGTSLRARARKQANEKRKDAADLKKNLKEAESEPKPSTSAERKPLAELAKDQPVTRYVVRPALTNSMLVPWPAIESWAQMHLANTIVQSLTQLKKTDKRMLARFLVGLNSVTRTLEANVSLLRTGKVDAVKAPLLLFACYADMDPPTLVEHLPILVAAYNSLLGVSLPDVPPLLLVPLSVGSESSIASALGIRNVSLLALTKTSVPAPQLYDLYAACAQRVHVLRAPWTLPNADPSLTPVQHKQYVTTVPLNAKAGASKHKAKMKQFREARTHARRSKTLELGQVLKQGHR